MNFKDMLDVKDAKHCFFYIKHPLSEFATLAREAKNVCINDDRILHDPAHLNSEFKT